jgi:O-antigen ligase
MVSIPLLTLTQVSFSEILNRLSVLQVGQELPELLNRGKVWGYFERLPSFQEAFALGNGFSYPFDTIQTYPHSLYLWIYWSGGIVALVFLCAAILAAFVYSVRRIRLNRINASLALSIVVFLAIDQSKIEVARFSSTTWLFWLMLALTFSRILPKTEVRDRNDGG